MIKKYLVNLFIAVDQLFNTILGGDPDETISSRCAKRRVHCKICHWLCALLNLLDPNHCPDSIEEDEGSRGL